jgi:hypothetical protein
LALFWTVTAATQGGGQTSSAAKGQSTSSGDAAIKQVADAYVKATLAGESDCRPLHRRCRGNAAESTQCQRTRGN